MFYFLVQFNNFDQTKGLLLELHALTLAARSYVLLVSVYHYLYIRLFHIELYRMVGIGNSVCSILALSPARAKNGEAPGTHCLHMHLISLRCGDSGLFSDSSASCDITVRTRYSKLVWII